jgi:tellurite methyltransferase
MNSMNIKNTNWNKYYQAISGREASSLLMDAIFRYPFNIAVERIAIDLGCGEGTDSIALLNQGWKVLAIDAEKAGIDQLIAKVSEKENNNLECIISKFENVVLPTADMVHGRFSLPLCHPDHFDEFWEKIVRSIKSNGRFVGHFFGPNDSWASNNIHMTFHSIEQVKNLFTEFEIEYFVEKDEEGFSTNGQKHWHFFEVIARKK